MAFKPISTIHLCTVPFDNTYKNVVYCENDFKQLTYFEARKKKVFTEYTTIRKTGADGSLQSSIKVNASIDELENLGVNYMFWENGTNGSNGLRYYFAFITQLIYINEGVTQIVYETDVFQTWIYSVNILDSYVVREHSETDEIGDNLVPEKFNIEDYTYTKLVNDKTLDSVGYLVATTEHNLEDETLWEEIFGGGNVVIDGKKMSGIYQGLFFYYFTSVSKLNSFLNEIVGKNDDCIVFIAVIPSFCVSENDVGVDSVPGWLHGSSKPAEKNITLDFTGVDPHDFEGYTPINNKLWTAPYYKLIITNHNGERAEYNMEDFDERDNAVFTMYGDVSANPSVTLIPRDYKGIDENYDEGISITAFPQCSFNTDTFKLWLAKNQFSTGLSLAGGALQIGAGIAGIIGTGGLGAVIGGGTVASGAMSIMNTFSNVHQASRNPNQATQGNGRNNLLTAIGLNKFEFYVQSLRKHHAESIDSYFTMYGYQTNKVKKPNMDSRPCFNYVQTIDINIEGGIPSDDMKRLKNIFNSGVTLWKDTATVGDYSVDNTP